MHRLRYDQTAMAGGVSRRSTKDKPSVRLILTAEEFSGSTERYRIRTMGQKHWKKKCMR